MTAAQSAQLSWLERSARNCEVLSDREAHAVFAEWAKCVRGEE